LKEVVVAPVDEGDVHRRISQGARRVQSAESSANDHHSGHHD
jgi:hypothetical protein